MFGGRAIRRRTGPAGRQDHAVMLGKRVRAYALPGKECAAAGMLWQSLRVARPSGSSRNLSKIAGKGRNKSRI
jgi:hypothetical protein